MNQIWVVGVRYIGLVMPGCIAELGNRVISQVINEIRIIILIQRISSIDIDWK